MKQLTDKEHAFFDTFGYLSVPQLLSADEVGMSAAAFRRKMPQARRDAKQHFDVVGQW